MYASLEHDLNINTGFTLYDEQTVARLIDEDPEMLPPNEVYPAKAREFYNRGVQNSITQGIIQGEGIPEIARRIADTTGEACYKSAVRNARTAYTGAQNAGRIEGLHQAQELGVKVKKKWIATLDKRTRDTHAELDGQVVDVDEPFEVDGMEIDYPGDPTADPSLVYNCRCTLGYVYPDYPAENEQRRDNETGEIIENMTYKQWEAAKITTKLDVFGNSNTDIGTQTDSIVARPMGEQKELSFFHLYDVNSKTDEEKLAQVNPNSGQSIEWDMNCQRVVVAEELIYRGYDVTAMPYRAEDPIQSNGLACWKIDRFEWIHDEGFALAEKRSDFKRMVKEKFDTWGEGARAIVHVRWQKQYSGAGHFLFARMKNGRIIYDNPQINKTADIDEILSYCTTSRNKLWILRVDNREVTDLVQYAVKNVGD